MSTYDEVMGRKKPMVTWDGNNKVANIDIQIGMRTDIGAVIEGQYAQVKAGVASEGEFFDWLLAADKEIHRYLEGDKVAGEGKGK